MGTAGSLRLSLALAFALAAAAGAAPPPEGDGANLYRAKCGKCHRAYPPAEISPADWESYYPKMQKRAHLTAEETETIRRYVEKNRPPPLLPPP